MTQQITVIHSTPHWLPQTMTWLHNLICNLPPEIENHIVCESTENLEQFPIKNLHMSGNIQRWQQILELGLRKLRLKKSGNYVDFLVTVIKKENGHILHSHFGNTGWFNINASRRTNVKHIVTFYGFDVGYLPYLDKRWIRRYPQMFENVDKVLCLGPNMAQQISEMGCSPNKIVVHHLGVSLEKIPFKQRKWKPNETLKVLIAATFREKKGIPYALEALGQMQDSVNLEITIIGNSTEEERSIKEKEKILAIIEKYNLHSKIKMMGFQPHSILLEEAYNHHIFLSPSITASDGDSEGTPVTTMEMAASGMPIVSTLHSDIPEIIKNRETGLLAKERDVDELVNHLKWLVDNYDQWSPMLKASRIHIEKEFDIITQAKKLSNIYKDLLNS